MKKQHRSKCRTPQPFITMTGILLGVVIITTVSVPRVSAQAFADRKDALVDYTKADRKPDKTCKSMNEFKSKDLVRIRAVTVAATGTTPEFCRVTGILAPEIAFEVSLPAQWNGRFYMFGNGGLAGQALDDPFQIATRNPALQNGFAVAHTDTGHDAGREPGGTFVLSNPQKAIDYACKDASYGHRR